MNQRDDAESTQAGQPSPNAADRAEGNDLADTTQTPRPDSGHNPQADPGHGTGTDAAGTHGVPDNAQDDPNPPTDKFAPVAAGQQPDTAWSQGRHDTTQLEVPPDGFAPYDGPGEPPIPPAGPPYGPGGPDDGGVTPQRPKRRRGLIVGMVSLSLVLLLVILGVGSELYLRSKSKDCLEQSFGELTGAPTSVSLSKKPMLMQWMSGEIPYVQVDTSDEGDSAMKLHARADDISSGDKDATVGELQGNGYVPFSRIMELSQQTQDPATTTDPNTSDPGSGGLGGLLSAMGGGLKVDKVTGNEAAGTITIGGNFQLLMFSLPAEAELKPITKDGKLTFEVVDASAASFGIPTSWAQLLVDQVSAGLFPPMFDQVSFDQLKVTDRGVEFAFSGTDIALSQSSESSNNSESDTCSVV
ncbi:LmeA family phospholipid-binding protein [Williamsia muralis]|uniref:LmeA family phospholipid-binding protein n=1 Tax=Williamsia marianensis TaxID=85044 RepID=UPI000DE5F4A2|nr:LmeA family phospholipid-binding protein [Williamsia marianensis]PVY27419.1 hypothetical protein C7458_11186 [Williamsia marianensis]